MSPLTCSLIALAALLAAADAQSNCNQKLIGQESSSSINLDPITTPPGGGIVDIPDGCSGQGKGNSVGEYVTACDTDANGAAPDIQQEDPGSLTPVRIVCPDPDKCPGGAEVNTLQYCSQ